MAFLNTPNEDGVPNIVGVKKIVTGTFSNTSGSTGGDINTGLRRVEFMKVQHTGSAVVQTDPVVNESFPTSTGDITVVTSPDADGIWFAYGE